MPRGSKQGTAPTDSQSAPADGSVAAEGAAAATDSNENRSEEVMIIEPAADEPVRLGGWILTENGWVAEDAAADEHADNEQEQE